MKIKVGVLQLSKSNKVLSKMQKIADVRNCSFDGRFMIVDEQDITFMLIDDNKDSEAYDVAVWIHSPYFVGMMQKFVDGKLK